MESDAAAATGWLSLAQVMAKPQHRAEIVDNVTFVALVQATSCAKRRLLRQNRLVTIQTVLVADPTRQFFKITSWETIPSVSIQHNSNSHVRHKRPHQSGASLPPVLLSGHNHSHDPTTRETTTIHVGDLIFFENCRVRSFRGAIEAQMTKQTQLTLLYREDHFFGTPTIRLQQVYSLIQWLQSHQQELLIANPTARPEVSTCRKLKDLRENMLVTVVCRIKEKPQQKLLSPSNTTRSASSSAQDNYMEWAMEELMMVDLVSPHCVPLYLFDQHAEPQFISRLVTNGSIRYEISHLLIQLDSFANQLVAHTTAQTVFRNLDHSMKGSSSTGNQPSNVQLGCPSDAVLQVACLDDLGEIESHQYVVIDNVRVVRMQWDVFLGSDDEILASHVPLLVESYCTKCLQTLPTKNAATVPELYGSCRNRCRSENSEASHAWRFRSCEMTLQDTSDQQLQVKVTNDPFEALLGNITAQMIVFASDTARCELPFSVNDVVAVHLNALTGDDSQLFRAEIRLNGHKELSRVMGDSILEDSVCGEESVVEPMNTQDHLCGGFLISLS